MARSLALVLDRFSNALRRGYSVATQSSIKGGVAVSSITPKSVEDKGVSWVPDPVTGYYKPENIKEVDVADLRATLLLKKFNK